MRTPLFQRRLGIALALALVLAAPLTAGAEEEAWTPTVLTAEHVTLDKTEFEYTGEAICPNVTVRVENTLLTLDKHYQLEFADNIEVGEGKVIVTGIATGGYEGTAEVPFTITQPEASEPDESEPDESEPEVIALEESHVRLDKTEFVFDGKAVKPQVTVTVGDRELLIDTDYTLTFEGNDKPGTAYAVVTALEDSGYTGSVRVKFTIKEAAPEYTITKGSGSKWTLKSSKTLSFTASGDYTKFIGVSVDGKRISDSSYTVKKGSTVVTLKSTFLNTLKAGSHTLTIHFTDGKAEGAFQVLDASDGSNPNTGDNVHLWAAVLFVSLTGLTGVGFAFRKKIWK